MSGARLALCRTKRRVMRMAMPPGVKDLFDSRKLREMERMLDVARRARLPQVQREAEDTWAALGLGAVVGLAVGSFVLAAVGLLPGLIAGSAATYGAFRFFAWAMDL